MGLKVSNRATPKQEVLLTDLGYIKSTNNWPLTQDQAAEIIDGLLENKKHDEANERASYGSPGDYPNSDDPFDSDNRITKEKKR